MMYMYKNMYVCILHKYDHHTMFQPTHVSTMFQQFCLLYHLKRSRLGLARLNILIRPIATYC